MFLLIPGSGFTKFLKRQYDRLSHKIRELTRLTMNDNELSAT